MVQPSVIPLDFTPRKAREMAERAHAFRKLMAARRTVRDFSNRAVAQSVIEDCIMTAASAPSGANQQPWTFVAISDALSKKQIREAAETEEKAFYGGRAPDEWLQALGPIGTDWRKPFLETAPWLIAVFVQRHGTSADGRNTKHYYAAESCGIATGLLIAALHNAGLATLTHTPSPMGFLNTICQRPGNEKPFVLIVTGYPAQGASVPAIERKGRDEVIVWKTAP